MGYQKRDRGQDIHFTYYGTSVTSVSKWTAPHCTKPHRCRGKNTNPKEMPLQCSITLLTQWGNPDIPQSIYLLSVVQLMYTYWPIEVTAVSHKVQAYCPLYSWQIYILTHWSHLSVPQSMDLLSVTQLMYTYWPIEVTYIYWGNLNGSQSTDLLSVIIWSKRTDPLR